MKEYEVSATLVRRITADSEEEAIEILQEDLADCEHDCYCDFEFDFEFEAEEVVED